MCLPLLFSVFGLRMSLPHLSGTLKREALANWAAEHCASCKRGCDELSR